MRFEHLYFLNGLFLVGLLAVGMVLWARYRRDVLGRFCEMQLVSAIARSFSDRRYLVKNILIIAVFVFSVLALARPQWGFEWQKVQRHGLDIILAIDTSRSMLTEDVKPNRLERTKLAVKDLLKKLKGDRVGLVAFSGDAFLVCPLTVDYSGFALSLDDLGVETIPRGGTNLGQAIAQAMKGYEDVPAKYKAVVILTDGENLEGDPVKAAREAFDKKVKICTVGIGTKEGELIRITNDQGEKVFLKDQAGNFVKSRLNETLLKEIAAVTGGAYVRASGAEFGLDYLYDNALSTMEKREIESQIQKKYYSHFQIPLFLAIILLVVEALISTRRPE